MFENLWQAVDGGAALAERQLWAAQLTAAAERLVGLLISTDRPSASAFVSHERDA
jgi:hypothetical protein